MERENGREFYELLSQYLPGSVIEEAAGHLDKLTEIRLRRGRRTTVTVGDENIVLRTRISDREFDSVVFRMCRGSVHAYGDQITRGFIPLDGGIRVGVCGTAQTDKDGLVSVREITTLNVRLPRNVRGSAKELVSHLKESGFSLSALVFSRPGVGKTTLLSDTALTLSSPPMIKRVAIADSGRELYRERAFSESVADVYLSYPKAEAINEATRTMSPQYIVCDEIGDGEADALISASNCGVPLLASAHSPDFESLLLRPGIKRLHEAHVFDEYIRLERDKKGIFHLEIKKREDMG